MPLLIEEAAEELRASKLYLLADEEEKQYIESAIELAVFEVQIMVESLNDALDMVCRDIEDDDARAWLRDPAKWLKKYPDRTWTAEQVHQMMLASHLFHKKFYGAYLDKFSSQWQHTLMAGDHDGSAPQQVILKLMIEVCRFLRASNCINDAFRERFGVTDTSHGAVFIYVEHILREMLGEELGDD